MGASNAGTSKGSNATEHELVITRVFDAPRELVFDAWTEAEHLKHWQGAPRLHGDKRGVRHPGPVADFGSACGRLKVLTIGCEAPIGRLSDRNGLCSLTRGLMPRENQRRKP